MEFRIRDEEVIENGGGIRAKSASKGEIVGKAKILADLVAEFLQNTNGESSQDLQRKLLGFN